MPPRPIQTNQSPAIYVNDRDRLFLESWARDEAAPARRRRAQVILALATGKSISAVCRETGAGMPFVQKWRDAYIQHGVDQLAEDSPPGGRPRVVDVNRDGRKKRNVGFLDSVYEAAIRRAKALTGGNVSRYIEGLIRADAGLK
jgi:transposase-like protein